MTPPLLICLCCAGAGLSAGVVTGFLLCGVMIARRNRELYRLPLRWA